MLNIFEVETPKKGYLVCLMLNVSIYMFLIYYTWYTPRRRKYTYLPEDRK